MVSVILEKQSIAGQIKFNFPFPGESITSRENEWETGSAHLQNLVLLDGAMMKNILFVTRLYLRNLILLKTCSILIQQDGTVGRELSWISCNWSTIY